MTVSSEMFFSIMRVLHDTLPCTKNFGRKRKNYRLKVEEQSPIPLPNAVKAIASPKMVKGLSLTSGRTSTTVGLQGSPGASPLGSQSSFYPNQSRQSQSPDFRVKKLQPAHARNNSRLNAAI